jgi:VWFA-related protein
LNRAEPPRVTRRQTARVFGAGFLVVLVSFLHGQEQKPPVFKSGVELVAIDVRVTDRDGRPLADLTPGDFEVAIDGKPRRVVSADFVTAASGAPARGTSAAADLPPEAVYSSNADETPAESQGRLIALLIDQGSFDGRASRAATMAAQRFLDRLGPTDRVSLTTFPGPGPRVAFTTNHALVRSALDRVVGSVEPWPIVDPAVSMTEAIAIVLGDASTLSAVVTRECVGRSRGATLDACRQRIVEQAPVGVAQLRRRAAMGAYGLAGIVEALGNIDGPKTAILVSAGFISGERVANLDTTALVRSVARSAAASRVTLYVLHLDNTFLNSVAAERSGRPAPSFADSLMLRSGLEILAGASGGSMQHVVAGADAAFERVAREISASYILGVEPASSDADGKAHKIQVRVRRPNIEVRSRTEFIAPVTPATPPSDAQRLAAVLTAQRMARALPIRLAHVTLRESAGRMRVILSADIGRGVTGPADVKVGYLILDASGRSVGHVLDQKRLTPVGLGAEATFSFIDAIAVPPGDYTVKFAALDSAGRLGGVTHVVEARAIEGDGLSASDMLMIDPSRRAESGGLAPTADGRITGLSVGVFIEIYPGRTMPAPRVSVSIADRPDGAVLTSADLPTAAHDEGRRLTAEGVVALGMLPPGTYVASATVLDGERRLVRVSRPFRLDPAEGVMSASVAGPRAAFGMASGLKVVRRFNREDALRADALDYFLGRLRAADGQAAAEPSASAASAVRAGQFDAALATLREAGSGQLSVTFLTGLALFAKGDLETAAIQFRSALRISNEFLPAVFYLGACYAAGGRDREAAGAWQTSLVTESGARIIFDVLADAWLRLQDGTQAMSILAEARERWPDDDSFLPRAAAAQSLLQERGQAVETLVPYIERHPADTDTLALAVRLLYDAHASGKPATAAARDRELAAKFARLYRAANGPEAALVDRWATFVQRSGVGR